MIGLRKILDTIDGISQQEMPVIRQRTGEATQGVFSLWKVSAMNPAESRYTYVAEFVADNGRVYPAYANQIWNKLVENRDAYEFETTTQLVDTSEQVMDKLFDVFHRLESEITSNVQTKFTTKMRALDFQRQRAEHIGIENIRNASDILKKKDSNV